MVSSLLVQKQDGRLSVRMMIHANMPIILGSNAAVLEGIFL